MRTSVCQGEAGCRAEAGSRRRRPGLHTRKCTQELLPQENPFPMPQRARRYKYLDVLTTMFVVILLVSNLVAQKICMIGPFAVSGAVLLFPITYIFGDVFTEVYGFSASRRAIWLGTLRDGAALPDGGDRDCAAGRAGLEEPAGVQGGVRISSAHPGGVADRVLGGRLRQLLHHGADEAADQRQMAVDADRRARPWWAREWIRRWSSR